MIFRADEGFEERPGFPGKLPQKEGLIRRQPCFAAGERPADPPGDSGGDKPEAQYGPSHSQRGRFRCSERDHRGSGNDWGDPHRPTRADEVVRLLRSGSPDGFHSSSRLCVISIRQTVRTIASRLKNAS